MPSAWLYNAMYASSVGIRIAAVHAAVTLVALSMIIAVAPIVTHLAVSANDVVPCAVGS
jgi:hypothetical protein